MSRGLIAYLIFIMQYSSRMPEYKIKHAEHMRRNPTDEESIFKHEWMKLGGVDFFKEKLYDQHPLRGFILDFFLVGSNICIEIDGGVHNDRKENDKKRDDILESMDIITLRYKNNEVLLDAKSILYKIRDIHFKRIAEIKLKKEKNMAEFKNPTAIFEDKSCVYTIYDGDTFGDEIVSKENKPKGNFTKQGVAYLRSQLDNGDTYQDRKDKSGKCNISMNFKEEAVYQRTNASDGWSTSDNVEINQFDTVMSILLEKRGKAFNKWKQQQLNDSVKPQQDIVQEQKISVSSESNQIEPLHVVVKPEAPETPETVVKPVIASPVKSHKKKQPEQKVEKYNWRKFEMYLSPIGAARHIGMPVEEFCQWINKPKGYIPCLPDPEKPNSVLIHRRDLAWFCHVQGIPVPENLKHFLPESTAATIASVTVSSEQIEAEHREVERLRALVSQKENELSKRDEVIKTLQSQIDKVKLLIS